MNTSDDLTSASFAIGTQVRVRAAYPPGHVRTPYFVRAKTGTISEFLGYYANPEELAYGRDGLPAQALYRVQFKQSDLWSDYVGSATDTVVVDIYQNWLQAAEDIQ